MVKVYNLQEPCNFHADVNSREPVSLLQSQFEARSSISILFQMLGGNCYVMSSRCDNSVFLRSPTHQLISSWDFLQVTPQHVGRLQLHMRITSVEHRMLGELQKPSLKHDSQQKLMWLRTIILFVGHQFHFMR